MDSYDFCNLCVNGRVEEITTALKQQPELANQYERCRTPLMEVCRCGVNVDAVIPLLIKSGADIEAGETLRGIRPLMWAAQSDNDQAIRLLLQEGADLEAKDTNSGMSALMYACESRSVKSVECLLEANVDTEKYGYG